jgi:beta-N-acetylhexosaminidase
MKITPILCTLFLFYLGAWWYMTAESPLPDFQSDTQTQATASDISVGEFFMIGHWTHIPTASTTALIEEYGFGGVIIMDTPENPTVISDWVAEWNAVSEVPLLIAIDQEGGPVTRLRQPGFTQTGQQEITTISQAYDVGVARGTELAKLGITMNFAPVLDTAYDPTSFMYSRTFRDSTNSAALAQAMIAGMQSAGVVAVPKHFPGHDDTSSDSHFELPVVDIAPHELDAFVQPFKELIATQPPKAMMTAHVLFPNIDELPVTLSPFFLQTYLRDTLGYQQVVITDDMIMDAIDLQWNTASATVLSLSAGADIILFAAEPTEAIGAYQAVFDTLKSDVEFAERLLQSQKRIKKLRE